MTQPVLAVGQPMKPDKARLAGLMNEVIDSGWYTNAGLMHGRLEAELNALWQVRARGGALALTSSGTMALMMALQLGHLPPGAEIITTPLSFPATLQAITWCGFTPVFADIDPERLTLCPDAVARAITPRTAAILGVHLTGVPCDHQRLGALAKEHGLWLVYDAAQSPDIALEDGPLWLKGNASALSFHATKLLHTCEGGAVITPDRRDKPLLSRMRHFGMKHGVMIEPGTNGKMSEMHAAMGLALLPDFDTEMAARRALRAEYDQALDQIPGLRKHSFPELGSASLLYYALRMPADRRDAVQAALLSERVLIRAGFPLLCGPGTAFPNVPIHTAYGAPIAPDAAPEVICLPLHGHMRRADVHRIARCIETTLKQA